MIKTNDSNPAALASKFVNHTNKHIFLTGKAGTGKTTFLKHIIQYTHKKAVIVAPTGIAAINAGGVTIHSLFQLPFGSFVPVNQTTISSNPNLKLNDPASLMRGMQMNNNKRALLREMELLIIDEVSMLRADLLDAIDVVLRSVRRQSHKAFGGVQVLFIGDLLQLPPVVKDYEWDALKKYYNSIYFFDARVLQNDKPLYIELEKIYRQDDDVFISLLNNLRNNKVTAQDVALLNNYYKPDFKPLANDNYITLTTHNYKADKLNKDYLQELKSKSFFFEAIIDRDFSEHAHPVERTLELKQGAQVMFVKNDPTGAQRFFNGKIGVISSISDKEIRVEFDDSPKPLVVETYEWQNVKYTLNEVTNEIEEINAGTFTQYPIKLAWAITVHKSQGLTFDKAIIDIGDAFAPGQVYVALSRLRSLKGLVLSSRLNLKAIEQDVKVTDFSKTRSHQNELEDLVEQEQTEFLKSYLTVCFDLSELHKSLFYHIESYDKDEKKSAKQQHKKWAGDLKEQIEVIKPNADKFLNQVYAIVVNKESGYLELLDARVKAASEYFIPLIKKMSASIMAHLEEVRSEKKIKTYLNELLELESAFYEQQKRIKKASVLTGVMLDKKEFTKDSVAHILNDKNRVEEMLAVLAEKSKDGTVKEKPVKGQSRKREKGKSKPEKGASKELSYELYKQGKTIEEIAIIRELAVTTVEGHLVQYIVNGKLSADSFIEKDKAKKVIAVAKELDSYQLNPIKALLGDDFSYSDIKFAIAGYLATKSDVVEE
jgi:hypothetical protein